MEDVQIVGRVALHRVVSLQYALVIAVSLGVAHIELTTAQAWVIEEEATAEVPYRLLGLRLELISDECHPIAGPSEHFGEEGLVAPLAAVADGMQREGVLEDKARQVPWGHHIAERH